MAIIDSLPGAQLIVVFLIIVSKLKVDPNLARFQPLRRNLSGRTTG